MKKILTLLLVVSFSANADYFQAPDYSLHYLEHSSVVNGWASRLPAGSVSITDAQASTIQAAQQAAAIAAQAALPNPSGFIAAVKVAVGGIIGANTLMQAYPAFMPAIQAGDWIDVTALILDAKSKGVITSSQYAAMQAAAMANNVPLVLP